MGEPVNVIDSIYPPRLKYAYLKHYSKKIAEEYVTKVLKGIPGYHYTKNNQDIENSVNSFFQSNKFTKEKLKIFEDKFKTIFPRFHRP